MSSPIKPSSAAHTQPSHKRPQDLLRHASSTIHYETFPTKPPKSKGKPPTDSDLNKSSKSNGAGHHRNNSGSQPRSSDSPSGQSPLPKGQLLVLAIIALAEQTALNSIAPYLPEMVNTFPDVDPQQVGTYVGLVASAFALAQFATNFFWGWLSDRIGRKPVILCGTLLTAACFVAFGFCRTLWQAILVQVFMGTVNGNSGVVSTCLGEITDKSNQSRAFTYLPVVYGLGGITGPIVGGLLVSRKIPGQDLVAYPYLLPNLVAAVVLIVDLVITMFFLEESLEELKELPPLGKRVGNVFTRLWQFTAPARSPTYTRVSRREAGSTTDDDVDDSASDTSMAGLIPQHQAGQLRMKDILNRDVILILLTFFVFQLGNVAYNSLYPIFAQAPAPTGRNLSPEEIGISLAFSGFVTILFQVGIFGFLRDRIGNKTTYRVGLAGIVLAFLLMPFVGYKTKNGKADNSAKIWLWVELGVILVIKTIASVGGLTSALLLVSLSCFCNVEIILLILSDHKLGTRSYDFGHAQRIGTDFICCRSCDRALLIRWPFLHRDETTAQGRSTCLRPVWWCHICGFSTQFWHPR